MRNPLTEYPISQAPIFDTLPVEIPGYPQFVNTWINARLWPSARYRVSADLSHGFGSVWSTLEGYPVSTLEYVSASVSASSGSRI